MCGIFLGFAIKSLEITQQKPCWDHDEKSWIAMPWRIHGAGIYANMTGLYWWDPCYQLLPYIAAPWIRHGNHINHEISPPNITFLTSIFLRDTLGDELLRSKSLDRDSYNSHWDDGTMMAISGTDSLEVPTIYKAYVWGLREYPHKIWPEIWY
jgi:hypothetical protein